MTPEQTRAVAEAWIAANLPVREIREATMQDWAGPYLAHPARPGKIVAYHALPATCASLGHSKYEAKIVGKVDRSWACVSRRCPCGEVAWACDDPRVVEIVRAGLQ